MLSYFTINKIANNHAEEIIEHYEDNVYCRALSTDEISEIIDNAFINGNVIEYDDYIEGTKTNKDIPYSDDWKEQFIVKGVNEHYDEENKTIDDVYNNHSIDVISGDYIFAIVGD